MTKQYIQADKNKTGGYNATEVSEKLNKLLSRYEYGDVRNEEFQIWEYPSGKIHQVVAKQFTKMNPDDYSSPNPDMWVPELKYIKTDEDTVNSGYRLLNTHLEKRGFLRRIFRGL